MRSLARVTLVVVAVLVYCSGAEAAVFTAGIGGTYPTIQEAVSAALAAGGDNHIKVRAGTFDEELLVTTAMTSGSLTLWGGYNAFFTSRNPDPSSTVIHSTSGFPAAHIEHSGGAVRFDGFTFTGDHPTGNGGAVYAYLTDTAQLFFDHCVITGSSSGGAGGGGNLHLTSSSGVELWDCEISNNLALNPSSVAGGGLNLYMNNPGTTGKITWSTIANNAIQTTGSSRAVGAGIKVTMYGGHFELADCVVADNSIGSAGGDRDGSAMYLEMYGNPVTATAELRRNRFHSSSSSGGSDVVHVFANTDVEVKFTDSWLSGGVESGFIAEYYNDSVSLILNNITVTDFAGTSIEVVTSGAEDLVSLTNSILWNNGTDMPILPAGAATAGNIVAVNPLFVDPAGRDFRLQEGSPAIDSSSGSPAGGFSATDLHGLARLIGSSVDAGGSEWGGLFADGFEVGTTRIWSAEE